MLLNSLTFFYVLDFFFFNIHNSSVAPLKYA